LETVLKLSPSQHCHLVIFGALKKNAKNTFAKTLPFFFKMAIISLLLMTSTVWLLAKSVSECVSLSGRGEGSDCSTSPKEIAIHIVSYTFLRQSKSRLNLPVTQSVRVEPCSEVFGRTYFGYGNNIYCDAYWCSIVTEFMTSVFLAFILISVSHAAPCSRVTSSWSSTYQRISNCSRVAHQSVTMRINNSTTTMKRYGDSKCLLVVLSTQWSLFSNLLVHLTSDTCTQIQSAMWSEAHETLFSLTSYVTRCRRLFQSLKARKETLSCERAF